MAETRWVVLDYYGNPLAGSWATQKEAVAEGLLNKYLLRGYEVVPAPADLAGAVEGLGWWCISGEALMEALRRTADGEDPGLVYAELYANSEVERP